MTRAIESGRFNIAISEFMKYLNFVNKSGKLGKQSYETFLKTLSPYAPFITEELWERAGNEYSIHQTAWPRVVSRSEVSASRAPIAVTINGKLRGKIMLPEGVGDTEEEVVRYLKQDQRFSHELEELLIQRVVYRPGKIVNIVT